MPIRTESQMLVKAAAAADASAMGKYILSNTPDYAGLFAGLIVR